MNEVIYKIVSNADNNAIWIATSNATYWATWNLIWRTTVIPIFGETDNATINFLSDI